MKTKINRAALITSAKALGFDHTDEAALMVAAMVMDPEFREKMTRFHFEKALREVAA